MKRYSDWSPTQFDTRGLNADDKQDWWVVGLIKTRDSACLDICNFDVALELLGSESDSVEVHRFGHWACGWFEIILVDSADKTKSDIAQSIEDKIKDYHILNEWELCDYEAECDGCEYCQESKDQFNNLFPSLHC
jgi:hypothetical protein